MSLRGLYEKIGICQETVQRGRHATLFFSFHPWKEEEREKVRRMNVAFYETFVAKAAEGRKKKPDEIEAVAQGRVWTGVQAVEAGLVDSLGGLEAAVLLARERARIPKGQEVQLLVLPQRKGFFETLMERQDEDVLARALGTEGRSFLRWGTALCGRGPIARVPYEVAVR